MLFRDIVGSSCCVLVDISKVKYVIRKNWGAEIYFNGSNDMLRIPMDNPHVQYAELCKAFTDYAKKS